MERERVRVKGGPTGLPKFFGGVIVGDGLGYSSFGGSDAFSVPSAVGWWAGEFCAFGGASSLWIALSSSSVELGWSAFGVTDFRYFFKFALWGRGSDRDYPGGGRGLFADQWDGGAVGSASFGLVVAGGIVGGFFPLLFCDEHSGVVGLAGLRQEFGGVDSGFDHRFAGISADLDFLASFGDFGSPFYSALCRRGGVVGSEIPKQNFLNSLGTAGWLRWV